MKLAKFMFSILFIIVTILPACAHAKADIKTALNAIEQKLEQLEASSNGRLGVFAIRLKDGKEVRFRSDETFPMCSTAKAMIVGAIFQKSTSDKSLLEKQIQYTRKDWESVGHAPITKKNQNLRMSVAELAAATMQYSDNAAANLLMKELNGPEAVTSFARSIGDNSFQLVRWEPELNSAVPGDRRDTTTPNSMANSMRKMAFGDALTKQHQLLFVNLLKGNTTGGARIRAGVPKEWAVGDKTGTCSYGTTNDIGIIWHPKGDAIVLSIYFTQAILSASPRDDVISSATQIVLSELY